MNSSARRPGCLPDALLEELAVAERMRCDGRGPDSWAFAAATEHLRGCVECRTRYEVVALETLFLTGVLAQSVPMPQGECVSDEALALYLDRGLDAAERNRTQDHVASCVSCQKKLVALFQEVAAVHTERDLLETGELGVENATVSLADTRADGVAKLASAEPQCETEKTADAGDPTPSVSKVSSSEERKQRYSSQSS